MGRYQDIPIRTNVEGVQYVVNALYPQLEPSENDFYVITEEGDRFDKLSQEYYGTVDYWWIIATVNSTYLADSLNIPPGTQIRIPQNISEYLRKYEDLNRI